MRKLIKNNSMSCYLFFTFLWTFTIVIIMIVMGKGKEIDSPTPMFVILGIFSGMAPSIMAFIVIRITDGKDSVKTFLCQNLKWLMEDYCYFLCF